jgi:hypothetical protein
VNSEKFKKEILSSTFHFLLYLRQINFVIKTGRAVFLFQKPISPKEKNMSQILYIVLFAAMALAIPESATAQKTDAAQKTQELVVSFNKTKYKKKEKKDFVVEVYVDIKNEPVVKNSVADYAGRYECEDGDYRLDLSVSGGKIEGSGTDLYYENSNFDKQRSRKFTLRDARIEGALLTATKVYDGGETQNFEAVFVNRTSIHGKNPNEIESRETQYGIAFIETNGTMTNRVFCEFKN